MAPNRKQTKNYNGFAIPLQPDTKLGLAMLIAEDDEGNHKPVAVVGTINEARETAHPGRVYLTEFAWLILEPPSRSPQSPSRAGQRRPMIESNAMPFNVTDADKLGAILHVVNDYANLVSSGALIYKGTRAPINTHVQYSFLVECRKFAAFFWNHRGPKGHDIVSKDYLKAKLPIKLPVWKAWHEHMNVHLMHLSYGRLSSKTEWNGHTVNADLLNEFQKAWKLFLTKVGEPYRSEYEKQIDAKANRPEYDGLDLR